MANAIARSLRDSEVLAPVRISRSRLTRYSATFKLKCKPLVAVAQQQNIFTSLYFSG